MRCKDELKLKKIEIENYTVFKQCQLNFNSGINVFIGDNGTGKTHLMKLLYSACQSASSSVSFSDKLVRTTLPDKCDISRLIIRQKGNRELNTSIRIVANTETDTDNSKNKDNRNNNDTGKSLSISLSFGSNTRKSNAKVKEEEEEGGGAEEWKKEFNGISSVFIPSRDVLTNNNNNDNDNDCHNLANSFNNADNGRFDDTYIDIVNLVKVGTSLEEKGKEEKFQQKEVRKSLKKLDEFIGGKLYYDVKKAKFYLKIANSKQEINLVSEGIRRMSVLSQLIKNGILEKGSVLFWDEPEANINPKYIPVLAELLIMLESEGGQIFVSTHDYFLAKYIEVKRNEKSNVQYISLYKDKNEDNKVKYETTKEFELLEHNAIMDTFRQLYREEVGLR